MLISRGRTPVTLSWYRGRSCDSALPSPFIASSSLQRRSTHWGLNMRKNSGFTLIELIAVMVILAILAVVAVPQFVDLRADARTAAINGVAGALSSAATLNFARRSVNGSGVAVADCADVVATLQGGALPVPPGAVPYAVTTPVPVGPGATVTCTLTGPGGPVNFTAIGIL